ncbi:CFI-box-CTERM domain-containing protein [Alkalimarinus alittae]|uniref:Uncharacterized protein n=1 Tax=Alkalimarinus alittae TaxID=2961619 RepID=A0ABY6N561_9ALTE|nr:CFI-box-CTERM domain-containing protein [Alkalimarinus alittae]UZE97250.1 hypothetical protein NKI27_05735 [Alkalimarinus alittae]
MKKQSNWVSASKVGRAAFCPHYLELAQKGAKVSDKAKAARIKGDAGHDQLNKLAEDKRCYVASHLYGVDDRRTQLLRGFRDQHLKNNLPGKVFINVYYRLSPLLISVASAFPALNKPLLYVVNGLVLKLDKAKNND